MKNVLLLSLLLTLPILTTNAQIKRGYKTNQSSLEKLKYGVKSGLNIAQFFG